MADIIKALSLHQPWASLIAVGAKRIETRSWGPPRHLVGQRLAIHATKRIVRFPDTRGYGTFNEAVAHHLGQDWTSKIPTGAVVAVATLAGAKQIDLLTELPEGDELLFGEYELRRWMWALKDVRVVNPPIPIRGHQGIWNFDAGELELNIAGNDAPSVSQGRDA